MVGKPVSAISNALPVSASHAVALAAEKGLRMALSAALSTLRRSPGQPSRAASPYLHKAAAVASGAVGGALGLATLPLELPVSTVIMLRSIADIAVSEGEDLSEPEAALSCIHVFALGAPGTEDASDNGYFAVRSMLAKTMAEAARFVAERSIVEESAPVLIRFIMHVASRFGVVVTQKAAAQALPVVGAFGGAVVNYAFMEHFQSMARGHFTVRRLERTYGHEVVRAEYNRLAGLRSGHGVVQE